jgi:hypothetical protein
MFTETKLHFRVLTEMTRRENEIRQGLSNLLLRYVGDVDLEISP